MKIHNKTLSLHELGQRDNQEDSICPEASVKASTSDFYILCDGMGGHESGEVASQTVCEAMSRYIESHRREDGLFEEVDFQAALDAAYDALDAKDNGAAKKMGTTLTFVKFHRGGCFVAHIGDSRIYQIRPSEKRIVFVTKDHSLVNDLIALGELSPEEAKTSKQRNVITRAMQPNQERRTKADWVNLTDIKAGDYLYMCSDGMLETTEDREIVNIISMKRPDSRKIEILKGATKDNKDNHSAHLIRITATEDESFGQESADEVSGAGEQEEEVDERPVRKRPVIWFVMVLILIVAVAYFYYK
ncbi:PP2C family protein-serine/threonine phosphatase [Odoribacter lunatus]|uniref:PP2C family protein-serine/threonine phosphatase n=1 Tax=Odoribacter lunatus TaxID=2941335 RepID=UPI00203FBC38|nr:protein phosphatase 2C domain-containing protein [Odoribacter lunatus]